MKVGYRKHGIFAVLSGILDCAQRHLNSDYAPSAAEKKQISADIENGIEYLVFVLTTLMATGVIVLGIGL